MKREKKRIYNFLNKIPKKLNKFFKDRSSSSLVVNNKSSKGNDYDPVTNFDKAFEKFIRFEINKNFPTHSIIGEEFKDKKADSKKIWSIDPIDGTRAFLIGAPTWSNLISFTYKNKSIFGLANFPELNKFYINNENKTFVIKNNLKKTIKCSKITSLVKMKIIGNFHGTLSYEKQKKVIKKFGWSFRLAGFDALNYCLLAEGRVDAVIEANLKPYDILPLIPIIKNSGGVVTNWRNETAEKGGQILATSNKTLHNKILKLLKPFSKKNEI